VGVRRSLRLGVGDVMVLLVLSLVAGAYLLYAMLRPERF
jgi:K+-transporting ATPase KdpF subunit